MKDLIKLIPQYLPQILNILPGIIKYIPVLAVLAGLGYGIYYFVLTYKDPYQCVDNEIYERLSIDSNIYKFKGGYCVEGKK